MANFYRDNEDLQFYVDQWIDWDPLARLTEQGYRHADGFSNAAEATQFYRDILEMVGEFVAEEVAPHAAAIDRQGLRLEGGEVVFPPALQGIFDKIKALELHGMCLPRELGGMNAPLLLYMLSSELMARADVSVMTHHSFHGGMAMAMLLFSILEGTTRWDPATGTIAETRFQDFIREIGRGDAWGCMDITEPDAGSDMAALRARGEQDADGQWTVTGQKIFITSGHGKYHFVIARTEQVAASDDPMAGLKGLSMFLVPTWEEVGRGKSARRKRLATVERLEEKLGHHGSATCTIVFDRTPAYLIGQRGEGFKYMLTLMNNARIGVGFESIGLCEAAIRMASAYAAERPSMGKTIDRHEMIADYLDEMRTDVAGLRALAVHGAYCEEMAQKTRIARRLMMAEGSLEAQRAEREERAWAVKARRVTPLLKYLAAEKAVEMARRAVQIHGGVGYTTEYGAEKLLRDAMVMPIYEGTSQIQALMAMKDKLSAIMKDPKRFLRDVAQARWRALSARDPLERGLARVQVLSLSAQQHLITRTAVDKLRSATRRPLPEWSQAVLKDWNPKRDFAFAMLHAERLTRLMADEAIGELLWAQAQRFPERRALLERHLERAEPRARWLHEEITTTGERLLARLAERAEEGRSVARAG